MIRPNIKQAQDLNRRIYASFPWGYRLAGLLVKLSFTLTETVGNSLYALFIEQGVTGMPPVNGKPAEELAARIKSHPERLPRNYGKAFGERIYAILLRKARNPDIVEEVLSRLLVKVAGNKLKINEGTDLRGAESYVFSIVQRDLVDYLRETKAIIRKDRDQERVHTVDLDDALDLSDPSAFQDLKDLLPERELRNLLRDVEHVHEHAVSWVEAQLEGLSNREIAAEWGVTPPRVTEWTNKYVPKIQQVVLKHLRDAA